MVEWLVQCVTGEAGRPASIRAERFATKREALAFIRQTPHSFISRSAPHTYTIYPKSKGK